MILITREPIAAMGIGADDSLTYRCLIPFLAFGITGGKILSYIVRVARIRRARSRSDFGINRITSPIIRSRTQPVTR
jgi:hypothetical protein